MILFVLVTGFFSLAPTWFLLKLLVEKAPRALLTTVLLIAAMGPVSWLAMTAPAVTTPAGGPSSIPNWPYAARQLLGLLIAQFPRRQLHRFDGTRHVHPGVRACQQTMSSPEALCILDMARTTQGTSSEF
jgi:hypothetical protein